MIQKKKSNYDKCISKILKEYDRLIAESSTLLSFDEKEIITKLYYFEEALEDFEERMRFIYGERNSN